MSAIATTLAPAPAPAKPHLDLTRLPCLGEALRDATIPFKSNVALIECDRERETRRLTYAELRQRAESRAAQYQQRGLTPGDRVAILMSNQAEWIISALGALWAGAVLVPIDYKLSPEEIAPLLEHADPRILVTEYPIYRRLRADIPDAISAPRLLISGAPLDAELDDTIRADAETARDFRYVLRRRDDPACIVYTSGTGGDPKGCVLSHHNYLVQAELLFNLFPVRESDRFFSILPTNHAIDFMCGFLMPMLGGGSILHQRTLRPQFITWSMERYRPTHMAMVPMILTALADRIRESLADLPPWKRTVIEALISANERVTQKAPRPALSARLLRPIQRSFGGRLRLVVCGGAAVDREDAELFYRLGIPVAIGYGLTEASTVVTVNDLTPFRSDTVGKPLPGIRLELRNLDDDGVGEVWVTGETVMQGYLDAPELTDEVLRDGWLRTGDLGRLDASGHLALVGRATNMVVTEGGKNVYPEDVEANLGALRACEEYCVMAANYVWPQRSLTDEELIVVLRPAGEGSDEAVADLLAANRELAVHKRVTGYLRWEEAFPRTASMKVKRRRLAEEIREQRGRDALVSVNGRGTGSREKER